MFAPKWTRWPHNWARFPFWDHYITPGYWAQYSNALPTSGSLIRSLFYAFMPREAIYTCVFVPLRLSSLSMAEAPVAVLPYVLMFARLRYLLRVTFYSVGRFQTGFHGGYHSLFDFHSVCRFELFHSVHRFQLLWHVSPSRWFFSACVAFQLAISGVSRFH